MDPIQPIAAPGTADPRLVTKDAGDVNRRILDKQRHRADFRRVEEASLKVPLVLSSPDAKRLYARIFYSYQVNVHLAVRIGRTRLPPEAVDKVSRELQRQMAAATKLLNDALDTAGAELEQNGITKVASYETVPLEDIVAVTSPLANRMLDLLVKLDQYMPLVSTLEILEVITELEADHRRSVAKRAVLALSSSALKLWFGVQRRMQEAERAAARAAAAAAQAPAPAALQSAEAPDAAALKAAPGHTTPAQLLGTAGNVDTAPHSAVLTEPLANGAAEDINTTASAQETAQPA